MYINKELNELSVEDLSQRYRGSWIMYEDQPRKVYAFEHERNDAGTKFIYFNGKNGIDGNPFKAEKLNNYRPPSRWINVQERLVYFHYTTERQFSRGFHLGHNVFFWSPVFGGGAVTDSLMPDALKEMFNSKPFLKRSYSHENLKKLVDTNGFTPLHAQMVAIGGGLYYRKNLIGTWVTDKQQWVLMDDVYQEEFDEVLLP